MNLFATPTLSTPLRLAKSLPITMATEPGRLLVQIASYNTNLQGSAALPQDLVDWLAPTLQVSQFLAKKRQAPDIVAVGFQELLPLHLGCMIYLASFLVNV